MNNGFSPFKTPRNPYAPSTPSAQPYNPFAGPSNLPTTLGQLTQPEIPKSYQIKEGDSFASIGAQFGLDEKKIQSYNKMIVTPPKGSYISLQAGPGAQNGRNVQRPPTAQALIAQGVPPYIAQMQAQQAPAGLTASGPYQSGAGPIGSENRVFAVSGANVGLTELSSHIKNQIANGIVPNNIPSSVLASLGATTQSMMANGYALNLTTNTWELGAAAGGGNPPPNPNTIKSVFYSKNRGYVTPEVAMLLDRRRRRKADENRAKPILDVATNAGETPMSTLDVRVESG